MPTTYRLARPDARRTRTDELRDGALVFESKRGLDVAARHLIEALPKASPGRVLCGMDGTGSPALAARALWPDAEIRWFHLDAFVAGKTLRTLAANGVADIPCDAVADIDGGPYDLIALPFLARSEKQLMWDLLEAAHDALAVGGRLVAATDGKPDALRAGVKKVFGKATPHAFGRRGGAAFYGIRTKADAALTQRAFVVRANIDHAAGDGRTSLDIETRPGTFSYRRLDAGTRALARSLVPGDADSVLDVGAGCGALGLYAAARLPDAQVTLVDSNARAIGCAQRNAERMGIAERVTALVRADVELLPEPPGGGYALAVTNPPYFSDFRIAHSFVRTIRDALRDGGRLWLVAREGKAGDAHADIVRETFGNAEVGERDGYAIITATRTSSSV